ncbi:TPA: hypothetical protein HA239_00655 [Candidatus Woesearchaeota archaeon]|nr:hypothetical protein QT06_C0001G0172 [archaeon GW2011_AR15]MBS3104025.1 hypothetical protein [Candidatus Woesearchaeota archaeon]HIH40907.1 hypothetical protein [Candidatus Woesearchaeota archaeon]
MAGQSGQSLEQKLAKARNVTTPSQKEWDDVFSKGTMQHEFKSTVRGVQSKQFDSARLQKWMDGYFEIAKTQRDFIKRYGVQAGLFKSSITSITKKGGVWRYIAENFPSERIRNWAENIFWNSVKGEMNIIPDQYKDMIEILYANQKVVGELKTMLIRVSEESKQASDFYAADIHRLGKELYTNLQKQKELEITVSATHDRLAQQKEVLAVYGVIFGEGNRIMPTLSLEASVEELSNADQREKDKQLVIEKEKYNKLNKELSDLTDTLDDFKLKETGYDMFIARAGEEYALNERILKKTIKGLVRQQELLANEYHAELEYGKPTTDLLTKINLAQALGVRSFQALLDYRNVFDQMLRLAVEEGDQIMDALSQYVLTKKWDPEKIVEYEKILDDRQAKWEELREKRKELTRTLYEAANADVGTYEVPKLN